MQHTKRSVLAVLATALWLGVGATPVASAEEGTRRWDLEEKPYAEMNIGQKVVSNARRGVLGLIDSVAQGAFSGGAILSPYGGLLVRKLATFSGDVIGLVDNNVVTEHLTQGIVSRQFLRYGTGGMKAAAALGVIHDTEFEGPKLELGDYTGDRMFHTTVYGEPSVFATFGAVVVSDLLVRPAGSLITIFGARQMGDDMHEWGYDLIQESLRIRFL